MSPPPLFSGEALRAAGRDLAAPFALLMPDGSHVEFLQTLRLLPGKRIAGKASWNGKTVFAKIFFAAAAMRHGEREYAGLKALADAGLPTPLVLATFSLAGDAFVILSEFLAAFPAVDDQQLHAGDVTAVAAVLRLVGRLHQAGLVQEDLHFDNFLAQSGHLLLIDGDGIRRAKDEQARQANLALLLSQLPPLSNDGLAHALAAYGRPAVASTLAPLVAAARRRRLGEYLGKTTRDCTQFAVRHDQRRFTAVLRAEQPWLAALLADPDAALLAGRLCKDGGTCTVGRVELGGRSIVIKRYNLKNWRHALSRVWRKSRAWHSWRAAHLLDFFGISTARPLAMVEERLGALRGRAYFITEYCAGSSLLDCLDAAHLPAPALQQAIIKLFAMLHDLQLSHGDLKASNLLWADGKIVLIDLDSLRQHRSATVFRRAWKSDRKRFLANWPAGSPLVTWLDAVLPV